MQDFESKEFRSYTPNLAQEIDMDVQVSFENIQLAEIEIENDLLLAVHRC
ncbi:hypothetical protein [Photorhabdus caribbeanensis]|nr:hypothetical protein [Photorhabdus caribbeanensis]